MARLLTTFVTLAMLASVMDAKFLLQKLQNHIKRNSNPDIPPIQEEGSPVEVTVVFQPTNIAHVDDVNNIVQLDYVLVRTWDSGIRWTPAEFSNIDYITLPKYNFWLPPLHPLQMAAETKDLAPPVITLFSNGTAVWYAVYHSKIYCDVSTIATNGSTCAVTEPIWGYSKDRVSFTSMDKGDMQFVRFNEGSSYDITGHDVSVVEFPTDGRIYQFANFVITIKAKEQCQNTPKFPMKAFFQMG